MSESNSKDTNYKLIIGVLTLIFSITMIDSKTQVSWLEQELQSFSDIVDDKSYTLVSSRTNKSYDYVMHDLGLRDGLVNLFVPKTDSLNPVVKKTNKMSEFLISTADNIQSQVYLTIFRFNQIYFWLLLLWPIAIALIYDGYNNWRIKRYSFGNIETTKYHINKKWVVLSISLLGIYFLFPIPLMSYLVLAPMLLILLVAYTVKRVIASFKKIF